MAVAKCCGRFTDNNVYMTGILLRWVTGEWEDCSASCGQTGWQRRWVSCQQAPSPEQQQRSVPSSLCGDNRPAGKRACNRLTCPSAWRAGPWTPVWPHKTITDYSFWANFGLLTPCLTCYWPSGNFNFILVDWLNFFPLELPVLWSDPLWLLFFAVDNLNLLFYEVPVTF